MSYFLFTYPFPNRKLGALKLFILHGLTQQQRRKEMFLSLSRIFLVRNAPQTVSGAFSIISSTRRRPLGSQGRRMSILMERHEPMVLLFFPPSLIEPP